MPIYLPPIDLILSFSNALAVVPAKQQPQSRIAGEQISLMEKSIADLDIVILKLVCDTAFTEGVEFTLQWVCSRNNSAE